ncbi:FMN-dependent NADH-azoreductase [Cognatishimia maritima]|uniref:FMN dependent NADH:quinone oxidoreductase n=1 Tax=Cognatishimia maritima TaxID=870908 RepID=A0A1M5VY73_9RHOB|nr:NAD(P)H-dependent oxidoreductase [Cognatishimia maritima]SHH80259.1 FMN-dependent NADH-azoreductase [Cognatishimia maritima]
MKLLHVDASAREDGSHSRALSAFFVSELSQRCSELSVDRLDLVKQTPRHFGAMEAAAVSISATEHTPEMREAIADSDALAERVLRSDVIVIGTPIYNFGMPSTLKAFFDHISRNGLTFVADANGMKGLLGDKKVAVLSAAGGGYGVGEPFFGLDSLTPHTAAILGFLGVTEIDFISARPMMFASVEAADAAMKAAKLEAEALARKWT